MWHKHQSIRSTCHQHLSSSPPPKPFIHLSPLDEGFVCPVTHYSLWKVISHGVFHGQETAGQCYFMPTAVGRLLRWLPWTPDPWYSGFYGILSLSMGRTCYLFLKSRICRGDGISFPRFDLLKSVTRSGCRLYILPSRSACFNDAGSHVGEILMATNLRMMSGQRLAWNRGPQSHVLPGTDSANSHVNLETSFLRRPYRWHCDYSLGTDLDTEVLG